MDKKLAIVCCFIVFYLTISFYQGCEMPKDTGSANTGEISSTQNFSPQCPTEKEDGFPPYGKDYGPPDWWCRQNAGNSQLFPIFRISKDYPSAIASEECSENECPWKKFSFKTQPREYLQEVIKYAYEGNLKDDWFVNDNPPDKKWYHAPFMHLDIVKTSNPNEIEEPVGREFIHGLTMERRSCQEELNYKPNDPNAPKSCDEIGIPFICTDPSDQRCLQSWAVSFYNARGSYYIKKVWDEVKSLHPNPVNFPQKGFPDGTISIKLLFTQATPKNAPYLEGSIEWEADIWRAKKNAIEEKNCLGDGNKAARCPQKMRLLQIDVAVRDDRTDEKEKSPTGWVFATFIYDNQAPPFIPPSAVSLNENDKETAWLKIDWVGLMFGNDPDALLCADYNKDCKIAKTEPEESVLNGNIRIPQHYGCGRRLNGPIDNPSSSCISCHSLSETPKDLRIGNVPYGEMKCQDKCDVEKWFRNINPRGAEKTFTKDYISLDYSLQLREGIRRFCVEDRKRCGLEDDKPAQLNHAVTRESVHTIQ